MLFLRERYKRDEYSLELIFLFWGIPFFYRILKFLKKWFLIGFLRIVNYVHKITLTLLFKFKDKKLLNISIIVNMKNRNYICEF